jgi:hypothetical protein
MLLRTYEPGFSIAQRTAACAARRIACVIWTFSEKNGVEKKSILSYVNSNHKKCDALQEALALLISSEKFQSSS